MDHSLIALFSGQRIGVEIASILLIFTGMTWNLTFSCYQSLTNIPKELIEADRIYRLNLWQQFWTLEFPSGVLGLVWNSVMSVAGRWFFLSPLIAWAEKFKFETVEAQNTPQSAVLDFLRRSPTLRIFKTHVWKPLGRAFGQGIRQTFPPQTSTLNPRQRSHIVQWLNWLFLAGVSFIVLWGTWEAALLLRMLNWTEWQKVIIGAIFTALRVLIALILSLAWTVPVGVAIGRNPRLAQLLQPIVQLAASVPATALFPVLLLAVVQVGGGLQVSSIVLMMLGTMWYVLFNVIAGAQSIPSDLFEAARVYKLPRWQRWQTVILLGIFPYLITGIITAVGEARTMPVLSANISTLKVE